ncbi:MAG: DinB family protein [Anaerolineae bacterium]|jgi:hypothetical protein|nr:DinB family protein [Anaerolineae bacterium]
MRSRDDAWIALDRSFKTFMDSLGHLTEEELTASDVVGRWSVKDVVAHVWSWVDEAVQTAKAWQGKRPWQEGVGYDDGWNEKQVQSRAALPLINVVDGLTGAHRRFMHLLDMTEDAELAKVGKAPWDEEMTLVDFFYSMAGHYQEHAVDLKNYQERCLECD